MNNQEGDTRRPMVKFKSRGRFKGIKEVAPFEGGDWKAWLQFQKEVNRLYVFLDMDDSDRSSDGLREVICQLRHGRDLDTFMDVEAALENDGVEPWRAIVRAMNVLAGRYCPLGTREQLHDEIKALRKTRGMTVAEYAAAFEDLLGLERWMLPDDGNDMRDADQCRYFSAGMPRSWQMQIVPQQARWTDLRELRERYLQCERVELQSEKNGPHNDKTNREKKKPKEWTKKQKEKTEPEKKRAREGKAGCEYCKSNGKAWKTHQDADCFRNPASPRFKPLAFWSKKCNQAQQQYTTNKKELLSVVEMLREFRPIIWGRRIRVYTDHKNSLEATFRNVQMMRWRLEIEEYGAIMNYVKGQENIVADALSRLPRQEEMAAAATASQHASTTTNTPLFSLSLGEIAVAQLQMGLKEGPAAKWRAIGSTKVLVSRVNGAIILPGSLVGKVLRTYHEWLVHPGEKIMLESIRQR